MLVKDLECIEQSPTKRTTKAPNLNSAEVRNEAFILDIPGIYRKHSTFSGIDRKSNCLIIRGDTIYNSDFSETSFVKRRIPRHCSQYNVKS